ncbi:MAG: DUF2207 domain-containing protein [Fimbriimonadaceae bacterium]
MRTLKKLFLLILCLLPILATADDGFIIDQYDVNLTVNSNSRMAVQEKISVTFNQTKHGIYREIPNRYNLPSGPQRRVNISGISVSGENTKITQDGNNLNIRIGDADVTFPPGTQKTYTINYQVEGAINWFEKDKTWEPRAEIYWNIIGPNWTTQIKNTTFQVSYPFDKQLDLGIKPRLFIGNLGSTQYILPQPETKSRLANQSNFTIGPGHVNGEISQTLNPGEAVSIVIAVPAQLITKPPFWETIGTFVRTHWGYFLPFLLTAILFPIWLSIGRDPKLGPPGVRFDPPEGIDPSLAGVLIDNTVDGRDVTAGIMSLAVQGYIKFQTDDPHGKFDPKSTYFIRTDKPVSNQLPKFEKGLLNAIDPGKARQPIATLSSALQSQGPTLAQELESSLVTLGFYRTLPKQVKATMSSFVIVPTFLLIYAGSGIMGGLAAAGLIPDTASLVFGLIACIPVYLFFMNIMPARTRLGAMKHNECLAFYEAMKRRANYNDWFTKTNLDQAKYEQYLPYAVAFNLVDEWAEICNSVVLTAPSFVESTSGYNTWNFYAFNNSFNNSIYQMNSDVRSSITPVTRSSDSGSWSGGSGFSGGGSSGGGFGGGGGGSW